MEILVAIAALKTNVIILNFVTNNAILLGVVFLFLNGIVRSTPWTWDNVLVKSFRNALTFVKPDFNIPDEKKE